MKTYKKCDWDNFYKDNIKDLKETFEDFDKRFNEKSSWYYWYKNNDKDLDMVLFMEKV